MPPSFFPIDLGMLYFYFRLIWGILCSSFYYFFSDPFIIQERTARSPSVSGYNRSCLFLELPYCGQGKYNKLFRFSYI